MSEQASSNRAACERKLRWKKRESADKAAAALISRDRRRGNNRQVRVYKCPDCQGYHITSMPQVVWEMQQASGWRYLWYRIKRWGRP